jgi:ribonuclease BN (tRNA processing enzyme)
MKAVLLGTGTPNPDPARSGPAVAILSGSKVYIVDLGPGIVRRAIEAGIKPQQMTRCFITHLHSDHTAGYPDFILTPAVVGRSGPLNVYGPKGLVSMTNHILKAYKEDIRERIDGLEPALAESYNVIPMEIEDGLCYDDDEVRVTAIRVDHGNLDAFGYKFSSDERTVVVSGDTRQSQNLITHARDCDILIHEVYSDKGFQQRPKEWQQYHRAVHTSAHELGRIATEVNPGLLVLYHQLFWGITDDDLVAEVGEEYDGKIISGKDLDTLE